MNGSYFPGVSRSRDESPHAPACGVVNSTFAAPEQQILIMSESFVRHLGGQPPQGPLKNLPAGQRLFPVRGCSSALAWKEIFFRSPLLSVCLKAPAYLSSDCVEPPCWPDSRLSAPLIQKHRRGCNLVPPKTFQGHLESHKTAERRCCLPQFFILFSQFPPDSCPAGGCHTWMANGGGGILG